jgi:membrane protein DedA with SNARE-associated domain
LSKLLLRLVGSYAGLLFHHEGFLHHYGAWVVFVLVSLESIGLPHPEEAILVSAAIFAGTTRDLSIVLVIVSAVVGAILGSIISFWIGDRYGYPLLLRYGCYIGLTETRIKIAQYLFRRQGVVVVLIARFVAGLRSVVGLIAGANRMPFVRFMIANSAGEIVWALFYGSVHISWARVSRNSPGL